MAADAAPPHSWFAIHFNKLESRPTVRSGERPGHLPNIQMAGNTLYTKRAGPCRWPARALGIRLIQLTDGFFEQIPFAFGQP